MSRTSKWIPGSFRNLFAQSSSPRAVRKPMGRLTVEHLETRLVPAAVILLPSWATANLSTATGELRITGSDRAEKISITESPTSFGGLTQLIITGLGSATIDGAPSAPVFFAPMVRSIRMDLFGGNDTASVSRNAVVFDTTLKRLIANPWYANVTSVVIDAGGGEDTINLSQMVTSAVVNGGTENDTLIGSAGGDRLTGGSGTDTLRGGPGNDVLFGAQAGSYGYQDGLNFLYGEVNNDRLVGGNGNDFLFGGNGNDSLFGGQGSNYLVGDPGADRFLVREVGDYISDLNSDDARLTFRDSFTGTANRSWTDNEIVRIDAGFALLHSRTNNTKLLKLSNGVGELRFERVAQLGGASADNDQRGVIRVADRALNGTTAVDAPFIIVHEIGHNWHPHGSNRNPMMFPTWQQFLDQSGWTKTNPNNLTYFKITRYGETWWLRSDRSLYVSDYAMAHPAEDFAESFRAVLTGVPGAPFGKAYLINNWLNSIST